MKKKAVYFQKPRQIGIRIRPNALAKRLAPARCSAHFLEILDIMLEEDLCKVLRDAVSEMMRANKKTLRYIVCIIS